MLPGLPALADCLRWLPAKLSVQLHWRPARLLHTGQAQPITRSHFCRNQSKAKFTNFARRGVLNLREKETWQSKNKFETEEKHLHGKGKVMLQILFCKITEWFFDQALKRRHWTWWVPRILLRQQPLLNPATKKGSQSLLLQPCHNRNRCLWQIWTRSIGGLWFKTRRPFPIQEWARLWIARNSATGTGSFFLQIKPILFFGF